MPSHHIGHTEKTKNLPVTEKCLAIVLSERCRSVGVSDSRRPQRLKSCPYNGKELLQEFKLRNTTCYWNPALVESIKSLCYKGFIEPSTILVIGNEIHLDIIRTAWGRRVLNAPFGFNIESIGDVKALEMQKIPQNQFIPLPDALCLIIMELNNSCVDATLETIKEKLHDWYKEMTRPNDQFIFDTLGSLIQQRLIFHSGCGYFVVTPETFVHTFAHSNPFQNSWHPYHPMYVSVIQRIEDLPSHLHNLQQHHKSSITRSLSYQSGIPAKPEDLHDVCKTENTEANMLVKKRPRSQSVSQSRRAGKEEDQAAVPDGPTLKRSTSLKCRREKSMDSKHKDVTCEVIKQTGKKEKMSLFSKLINRVKKRNLRRSNDNVKGVDYVTFSAQFPPPEWQWYKHQIQNQKRTGKWVYNQVSKSVTSQSLQSIAATTQHARTDYGKGSDKKTPSKSVGITHSSIKISEYTLKNEKRRRETWKHRNSGNNENIRSCDPSIPFSHQKNLLQSDHKCHKLSKKKIAELHRAQGLYESIATPVKTNHSVRSKLMRQMSSPEGHSSILQNQKQKLLRSNEWFNLNDVSKLPKRRSCCLESRDSGVNCISLVQSGHHANGQHVNFDHNHSKREEDKFKFEISRTEAPVPDEHLADHIESDFAVAFTSKCHCSNCPIEAKEDVVCDGYLNQNYVPTVPLAFPSQAQNKRTKVSDTVLSSNSQKIYEKILLAQSKKLTQDNAPNNDSDLQTKVMDHGFSSPLYDVAMLSKNDLAYCVHNSKRKLTKNIDLLQSHLQNTHVQNEDLCIDSFDSDVEYSCVGVL